MSVLCATLLLVVLSDQAVKLLLRRRLGGDALALGPFGSVRTVAGRLWLRRLGGQCSGLTIWCLWGAAAVPLIVASALVPSLAPFAGLLLGGSLSHVLENALRGNITDYICLRFWPAFDLADLALAVGAVGIVWDILIVKQAVVF
jgi:signal peptidase II